MARKEATPTPFQRFEALAKGLIAVPPTEVGTNPASIMNSRVDLSRADMDTILSDVFDAYDVAIRLLEETTNPKNKSAIKNGIIAGLDRALEHLTKEGVHAAESWKIRRNKLG